MAGGGSVSDGATYSGLIGFIYVFNLVVGFGALTLPYVFHEAGYLLGSAFLAVLGFLSYVTATFIVECMSIGNAIHEFEKSNEKRVGGASGTNSADKTKVSRLSRRGNGNESEGISLESRQCDRSEMAHDDQDPFELRKCLELGDMAKLFLGQKGYKVLVGITGIYLYGDLAIYASATPTTLVTLFPGSRKSVSFPGFEEPFIVDRLTAYRTWLVFFAMIVVPLSCLNFQKTKHLQIFTCTYRNIAIFSMIGLAFARYMSFSEDREDGMEVSLKDDIPLVNWHALPKLFGAATYSFMCHHSIPSIIFPIETGPRRRIIEILALDYFVILCCYLSLCGTAYLAFGTWEDEECVANPESLSCSIQTIYILNFDSSANPFFGDFLTLLPVFICFTNYPLIAITTRNNLAEWFDAFANRLFLVTSGSGAGEGFPQSSELELVQPPEPKTSNEDENSEEVVNEENDTLLSSSGSASSDNATLNRKSSISKLSRSSKSGKDKVKLWHSLLVAVPPIFIAYLVSDVSVIVEFTGSYAGLALEFLFPCWLVLAARKRLQLYPNQSSENSYRSPFQSLFSVCAVCVWSIISFIFIVYEQLLSDGVSHEDSLQNNLSNATL